jgi:hypothetical protein
MSEQPLKAKQKLQWLGLSSAARSLSNVEEEMELLREHVGEYSTFSDHLENGYDYNNDSTKESLDSYSDFESYLTSVGFSGDESAAFIEKIKQNFTDEDSSGSSFDEFKTFALDEADSYEKLKTAFGSSNEITSETQTEDGQSAAGIKFHESGGVTRDGVAVPAGSTEIFGKQIHYSESDSVSAEDTSDSSGFTWSNIRTESGNQNFDVSTTVTIKADVTSSYNSSSSVTAPLIEDGSQIDNKTIDIGGSLTKTVSFDIVKSQQESREYAIGGSDTIQISWTAPGVTRI